MENELFEINKKIQEITFSGIRKLKAGEKLKPAFIKKFKVAGLFDKLVAKKIIVKAKPNEEKAKPNEENEEKAKPNEENEEKAKPNEEEALKKK